MFVRFRGKVAAALTAAVLGAAACSSSTDGSPSSSPMPTGSSPTVTSKAPSTSAPVSPSQTGPLTTGPNVKPGEKPPVEPALAYEHTATGALVYASYFVRAMDWSYATNSPYLLQINSSNSCSGCQYLINGLVAARAKGQTVLGGRMTLGAVKTRTGQYRRPAGAIVQVTYSQTAISTTGRDGSHAVVQKAVHGTSALLFMDWVSTRWLVTHFTNV